MINSPSTLFSFLILITSLSINSANSQDNEDYDFTYNIERVYPPLSISKAELLSANTIKDLNRHFKPDWIKEYKSIEIKTEHDGITKAALSYNDILTAEQKENLLSADPKSYRSVKIIYLPANNLKENELKEINFSFPVEPENPANFIGSNNGVSAYLQKCGIADIPRTAIKQYSLAVVKFTVDTEGTVINAHVAEPSQDKKADELMLESICNMPDWIPASYSNGEKIEQDFVLTVGDRSSCILNLYIARNEMN